MRAPDWAERSTEELLASGLANLAHVEGAQSWQHGAYTAFVCGRPYPPFNGVLGARRGELADLDAALDRVEASGLPHLLRMRHGVDPAADARLVERGYRLLETDPAMVLVADDVRAATEVPGLVVERVRGEDGLAAHLDVALGAFGGPRDLVEQVVTVGMIDDPAFRFYVGRVDGRAVTTGIGIRTADSVGIYTVGTPEAERGKGYGTAVTARAVADGLADGATWAYLMSSEIGYGVYERLGFRTVERWDLWAGPDAG